MKIFKRNRPVIFYALLESADTRHDRWKKFYKDPGIDAFWDWTEEIRGQVRKMVGDNVVITNVKILK